MNKTNIARLKIGTLGMLCLIGAWVVDDPTGIFNEALGAVGMFFLLGAACIQE